MDQGQATATVPAAPPLSSVAGRASAVAAAWLLQLLLLDAAIETWLAAAPARGTVAAASAAFLGLSMLVRRRVAAGTRAALSLLVLLALAGWCAWRPGGTATGLVMLGQPTGIVLIPLVTAATILAGWAAVSQRRLPVAIRIGLALLATYGVVAAAWGAANGTPYPALLHGRSEWTRLPYWLQGAFIAAFVVLPVGLLSQAFGAVTGRRGGRRSSDALLALASACAVAVAAAAFAAPPAGVLRGGGRGPNGPGLRPLTIGVLPLPVARSFDLSHVQPAHFAAALANDPIRIFEFVRDQVAYEPYPGCLRGPRGTLLAMAGNSVDRASLLQSMLQAAGQRVRYARGTLQDFDAGELLASTWAARDAGAPAAPRGAPKEVKAAAENLARNVERDALLLRDRLKGMRLPSTAAPSGPAALLAETRDHYWVQWWHEGAWTDLDPSFADSRPGGARAGATATFDALPSALFHRLEIRVALEEYSGATRSSRDILRYAASAAELSGVDLVLVHQVAEPAGPETDSGLGGFSAGGGAHATASRVEPLLIVAGQEVRGSPFNLKAPPASGGGLGFGGLLGEGEQERPELVATAESISFTFLDPNGGRDTAVREIFDRVGPARRQKEEPLSAADVDSLPEAPSADEQVARFYDLYFTTGGLHSGHLTGITDAPPAADQESIEVQGVLRRVNIAFCATSDALMDRAASRPPSRYRLYPDSPRVYIADFAFGRDTVRLSLDLRRDRVRAVAVDGDRRGEFHAQVLRGVVDGTLERILVEQFSGPPAVDGGAGSGAFSASLVFDLADRARDPLQLLSPGGTSPGPEIPEASRARIGRALADGQLIVAPSRAVSVGGTPRFAWWQVDASSGATLAVTDEGLHPATVEAAVIRMRDNQVGVAFKVNGRWISSRGSTKWLFRSVDQARWFVTDLQAELAGRGITMSWGFL